MSASPAVAAPVSTLREEPAKPAPPSIPEAAAKVEDASAVPLVAAVAQSQQSQEAKFVEWKSRLTRYYMVYDPQKTDRQIAIVAGFIMDNPLVWKAVLTRHGPENDPPYDQPLPPASDKLLLRRRVMQTTVKPYTDADSMRQYWEVRLKRYFAKYAPAKSEADIHALVAKVKAEHWDDVWLLILRKYGPEPLTAADGAFDPSGSEAAKKSVPITDAYLYSVRQRTWQLATLKPRMYRHFFAHGVPMQGSDIDSVIDGFVGDDVDALWTGIVDELGPAPSPTEGPRAPPVPRSVWRRVVQGFDPYASDADVEQLLDVYGDGQWDQMFASMQAICDGSRQVLPSVKQVLQSLKASSCSMASHFSAAPKSALSISSASYASGIVGPRQPQRFWSAVEFWRQRIAWLCERHPREDSSQWLSQAGVGVANRPAPVLGLLPVTTVQSAVHAVWRRLVAGCGGAAGVLSYRDAADDASRYGHHAEHRIDTVVQYLMTRHHAGGVVDDCERLRSVVIEALHVNSDVPFSTFMANLRGALGDDTPARAFETMISASDVAHDSLMKGRGASSPPVGGKDRATSRAPRPIPTADGGVIDELAVACGHEHRAGHLRDLWKDRLVRFYRHYDPSKAPSRQLSRMSSSAHIDACLDRAEAQLHGGYDRLMHLLVTKYGPELAAIEADRRAIAAEEAANADITGMTRPLNADESVSLNAAEARQQLALAEVAALNQSRSLWELQCERIIRNKQLPIETLDLQAEMDVYLERGFTPRQYYEHFAEKWGRTLSSPLMDEAFWNWRLRRYLQWIGSPPFVLRDLVAAVTAETAESGRHHDGDDGHDDLAMRCYRYAAAKFNLPPDPQTINDSIAFRTYRAELMRRDETSVIFGPPLQSLCPFSVPKGAEGTAGAAAISARQPLKATRSAAGVAAEQELTVGTREFWHRKMSDLRFRECPAMPLDDIDMALDAAEVTKTSFLDMWRQFSKRCATFNRDQHAVCVARKVW